MIAATISDAIPSALIEAGRQDDQAGDRREHEGGEVGEDVPEGALDVERVPVRPRRASQVAARLTTIPRHGDDQDDAALDGRRVDQPADRPVDDQQAEHEQRRAVELGAEDPGALPAERHRALARPTGEPDRRAARAPSAAASVSMWARVGEQQAASLATTTSTAARDSPSATSAPVGAGERCARLIAPPVNMAHGVAWASDQIAPGSGAASG